MLRNSSLPAPLLVIGSLGAGLALWFFPTFSIISLKQITALELGQVFLGFIFVAVIIERAAEVYSNVNLKPEKREIRLPVTKAEVRVDLARKATMAGFSDANLNADAANARQNALEQALNDLQEKSLETTPALTEHESKARKQTSILAMSLGILAAIVGIRALGSFLEPNQLANCIAGGVDPELQNNIMDAVAALKGISEQQIKVAKSMAEEAFETPCLFEDWQRRLFTGVDVLLTGALLGGGADAIHQVVKRFLTYVNQTPYNPTT